MKKGILLNNALVKSLALFVMMLISYNGMAQEHTFNVGNNIKYYRRVDSSPYFANIISSKEQSFAKQLLADKIIETGIIDYGGYNNFIIYYTPSHGYFVEFIYRDGKCMMIGGYNDNNMIVLDGSNLYLVEPDENNYDVYYNNGMDEAVIRTKIIGTITDDLNNRGDDFQIFLDNYYREYIGIINNGIIKYYSIDKIKNTSSVRSPEVGKSDTKTYSLDGKQVESPHNGIFIRGGKKVVIK